MGLCTILLDLIILFYELTSNRNSSTIVPAAVRFSACSLSCFLLSSKMVLPLCLLTVMKIILQYYPFSIVTCTCIAGKWFYMSKMIQSLHTDPSQDWIVFFGSPSAIGVWSPVIYVLGTMTTKRGIVELSSLYSSACCKWGVMYFGLSVSIITFCIYSVVASSLKPRPSKKKDLVHTVYISVIHGRSRR